MKPCEIVEKKQMNTTCEKVAASVVMRARNFVEKSCKGAFCEGTDQRIASLSLKFSGGVADEDMLDEFLANRRDLEHGQSSTMDVRRFLNVTYHQASMGKLKKVAAIATIAILIIMVVTFSFRSPSSRKLAPATYSTPTPPTEEPGFQNRGFVLAVNPDIPFDLGLKCHLCALVSSSGMLLDSNAGSQIDSADCVLRLNTAPVLGYEKDIGQKTTVRVLSLPGLRSLLRDQILTKHDASDYMILLGPGEVLCKNCTVLKVYQELASHFKHTKFVQVTQEAYRIIKDEAKELGIKYARQDLLPSARFYALRLMRNVCTQIRLYGIERGNPCYSPDSVPLFYWDPGSRARVCSGHVKVESGLRQINLENKVFTSWAENSDMEFFYPSR